MNSLNNVFITFLQEDLNTAMSDKAVNVKKDKQRKRWQIEKLYVKERIIFWKSLFLNFWLKIKKKKLLHYYINKKEYRYYI